MMPPPSWRRKPAQYDTLSPWQLPCSLPSSSQPTSAQLFGRRSAPVPLPQMPPKPAQSASPLHVTVGSPLHTPQKHIDAPRGASQGSPAGNDTEPLVSVRFTFRPAHEMLLGSEGWHWYEVAPKSG